MVGRRIGPYRLVRLLGRGGMGSVHLACETTSSMEREVAIKLLKRGMDTDFMLQRFRQERQILASLEHPFIARLIDGGATDDGLPYFVLQPPSQRPVSCRRSLRGSRQLPSGAQGFRRADAVPGGNSVDPNAMVGIYHVFGDMLAAPDDPT